MKRICKVCNLEKNITEFRKDKTKKSGYRNICKVCRNKEKVKNYDEKFRKKARVYYLNNKEKINKKAINYSKNRYKNDNLFKLSCNIRSLIKSGFRKNKYNKSYKSEEILGCSFEDFKLYLESKFEDWMNWENRGLYNGEFNYGWDIDHIIPLSSANSEEDIIKLSHYTNLQPLCSKINRDIKKSNTNYERNRNNQL
jgi:hypothetical protein